MKFVNQAHFLLKQFLHNLDEADWASRHIADLGPDLPAASRTNADGSASSLAIALQQMGLVSQSSDSPGAGL